MRYHCCKKDKYIALSSVDIPSVVVASGTRNGKNKQVHSILNDMEIKNFL